MQKWIYLDNNATTSLDPRVLQCLIESLSNSFGNPSSVHRLGQKARAGVLEARTKISSFFSLKPHEIVFTSSATEALNLLIRGVFGFYPKGHIITSNVEHAAVDSTVKILERAGCSVTYLPAGLHGAVQIADVQNAIREDTRLIALMAVNNETGVKTDIEKIAMEAQMRNIPFFVDAVAVLGKESFSIPEGVTGCVFSGHKIHGPKGIGIACIRKGLKLNGILTGGEQENGFRAGTENVPSIIAFAKAIELVEQELQVASSNMLTLRDYFENELQSNLDITINGSGPRTANTSNICFHGVDGDALLMRLDANHIAASMGSACSSGTLEPSRILLNMGLSQKDARSSLRFSLSRFTTKEEIEQAIDQIIQCTKNVLR